MNAPKAVGWILVGLLAWPLAATADVLRFMHTDLSGSVVAVTDESGAIIERRVYEPYGLPTAPIPDGPGYTGHDMDGETGLVYMQQRYYDPEIGRFLSIDPDPVNTNTAYNFGRYHYAANSPYVYTDPDGEVAVFGFVVGVSLEITRQVISGEFNDTSFSGIAKNAGKAAVAGLAGATGAGLARGVAGVTASITARAAANSAGGAAIGAGSRVGTNAIEGNALGDGVVGSAIVGGVAGGIGSVAGDLLTHPAQRLADSTSRFIGTSDGVVAVPTAHGVVGAADATGTVISNIPGVAGAVSNAVSPPPPPPDRHDELRIR